MIIWEMFNWRISLNSVLLLLLVNFASGSWLELMYISLIISIRSNLSHLQVFQLLVLLPHLYQQESSKFKVKFREASNCCKRVQKGAKLAYATKTKQSFTSQRHGSQDFWQIANSIFNKGKSAIPTLSNGPEVLSSAFDYTRLFAKKISNYSNLDDSGISLPVFCSRTNLNISITPKMIKKVITNLDSSKATSPDCIPVVVLKNCEPDLSYILAELFNMRLKESCFPYCWKV